MKELSQLAESVRQRFLDDLSGYLGLDPGWKSSFLQDSVLRERFVVMQKSDLLELADAGMSIGAHSLSHPVLSEQSSEMIETEIAGSRDRLAFLPKPVWAFAYPFGEESSAGEREFRCTREAGFRCAFMNVGGSVRPGASPFSLPRVHVTAQMSLGEFEARVCGFDSFLRKSLSLR
jgi:peptidoglycan/xylan/chitin deacetylase (PgdA/CDA1 family)